MLRVYASSLRFRRNLISVRSFVNEPTSSASLADGAFEADPVTSSSSEPQPNVTADSPASTEAGSNGSSSHNRPRNRRKSSPSDFCIRLSGCPRTATPTDIRRYFEKHNFPVTTIRSLVDYRMRLTGTWYVRTPPTVDPTEVVNKLEGDWIGLKYVKPEKRPVREMLSDIGSRLSPVNVGRVAVVENIPTTSTLGDIRSFFRGCSITQNGIRIEREKSADGKWVWQGRVSLIFETEEDAEKALREHHLRAFNDQKVFIHLVY